MQGCLNIWLQKGVNFDKQVNVFKYLLNTDSLSLKPLPLQALPFKFLSLHLQSLALPEQVLPFFSLTQETDALTLPTISFSNFTTP